MTSLNNKWLPPEAARKDSINPKLDKLLREVTNLLRVKESDQNEIKKSLVNLIYFLCTKEGRTGANCITTDSHFCLHEDHGFDWQHLPKSFQLILDDIGGQLHDAISTPQIVENFESTPEQLLERLNKLTINNG